MIRCLLICEGSCDQLIFSLLKNLFDENILEIKPFNRCCADRKNLFKLTNEIVEEILAREHGYALKDFQEICYLIDSDGMFISEDKIFSISDLNSIEYTEKTIRCKEKRNIVTRNNIRVKNVADLLKNREYWIFYNSRNLEHAFDKAKSFTLTSNAKRLFALEIQAKYLNNEEDFIRKLFDMNKSKTTNLFKSWEYLKEGSNSLSSCSNIIIFIIMHFNALKKEYKDLILKLI